MILNKTKTKFLQTLIASGSNEYAQLWMEHDTALFSNNEVSQYGTEVDNMKAAYDANPSNLYGTNEDDSQFQFTGISPFPRKPQR